MDSLKRINPETLLWYGYAGMFFSVPLATSPTVICGIFVLAVWILSLRFLSDTRTWLKSDLALPILILMVLPWVGLTYTPLPADGLALALKTHYWLYTIMLPPLLSVQKRPDRLIKMFLAGLSLNSVISVLQHEGMAPLKKGFATGLMGGSSAWIAYSLFLTSGILLASFYFLRSSSLKERALYACLMLLYFIVLGFTGGRSGYIALIVLSPVVVYNLIGQRHIVGILLLCVVVVGLLFTSQVVRSRFAKAGEDIAAYEHGQINTSLGLRFRMWEIAWSEIKKNPLLGVGTGGFARSWELYKKDPALPFIFHPHNSFIYMMVSHGILGLAAFCRLLWVMVKKGWKDRGSALGFAVFSFGVTYIIGSLSDTEMIVFATAVSLPLFAGISQFVAVPCEDVQGG